MNKRALAYDVPIVGSLLTFAAAISPLNADFIANPINNATWPSKGLVGFPAMPAVIFNASSDGVADWLFCNHSSFPPSNSFYGASDWSLEAWVYTDVTFTPGDASWRNPLVQWGPRAGEL